jgi:hypothetical protein
MQQTLQQRARAKHITNAVVRKLAELNSPLVQQYWNAYHCSAEIQQQGDVIKSRYCNKRWCLTCNRIRTAKLINGYGSQIAEFKQPMFVTLSAANVPSEELPDRITEYHQAFNRIRVNIQKTYGMKIKGVRKLEVTHNESRNDYHPHFHLIIEGSQAAYTIVDLWLKQWKEQADAKAQDIRPAVDGSTNELFKYVVKLSAKGAQGIQGLDTIFQALKGRRLVASYQIKMISEDVAPEQAANCDWKAPGNYNYSWNSKHVDWMRGDGEPLSGYIMDPKTKKTVERILCGIIEIEAPVELQKDIDRLTAMSWQNSPFETNDLELDLVRKMIDRDNRVIYGFENPDPPPKPKQLKLNI